MKFECWLDAKDSFSGEEVIADDMASAAEEYAASTGGDEEDGMKSVVFVKSSNGEEGVFSVSCRIERTMTVLRLS